MSNDHIATLALELQSQQFNAGLQHSQALMQGLSAQSASLTNVLKGTATAMMGLYAGSKMVNLLGASVRAASSYREDLAQFDHVMRNVTKSADEMMKSLTSADFGRTETQARQMLMTMTSMAKGMGMTDKAALELAGNFSKMSIDIGSFMMRRPEDVMNAFQSALMGETMALRTYGIHLTEASLKETIAANAKKGMVFASEREARSHAVLTETYRQQADAIGDFAVEQAQFGNQLKQFYAGLSELPAKFGKGLLEPVNKALKTMNTMITALRGMDDLMWKTISTMTTLGTAASLTFGTYKIGKTAVDMYAAAKEFATAVVANNTVALGGNTVALSANNAATMAGTNVGATAVTTGVARRNRLPYQNQQNVWEEQAAGLRTRLRAADSKVLTATRARDATSDLYNKTGDIKYFDMATRATDQLNKHTREKLNLERAMQNMRDAQRRNPLNLNAAQMAERQGAIRDYASRMRYAGASNRFNQAMGGTLIGRTARGVGGVAGAVGQATGLSGILKTFGSFVMRWLPGSIKLWGGIVTRGIATSLLSIGATVLTVLNPVAWGIAIVGGLALVGNYLPKLMHKGYDAFMFLFKPENMKKISDTFSSVLTAAWNKTIEWLGKGIYGIIQSMQSIWYGIVNGITKALSYIPGLGIKATNWQTEGYLAYEAQKRTEAMQAALDARREEQAKRERQVTEFKLKVSEQENEWLKQEEENAKKRKELSSDRIDSFAKEKTAQSSLNYSQEQSLNIESAMQSVQEQMDWAGFAYQRAVNTNAGNKDLLQEQYNKASARMSELRKKQAANALDIETQNYSLFDAKFANADKAKGYRNQMSGYRNALSFVQNQSVDKDAVTKYEQVQKELAQYQKAYSEAIQGNYHDDITSGKANVADAEKRLAEAEIAYNRLLANESDQRKVREKIRKLKKQQEGRYLEATKSLWEFNYDNARPSAQRAMAQQAFFKARNQFEGARTDEERERALGTMQDMYSRLDKGKPEMPAWNGFLSTTAGGIESNSIQAQDLQNRIVNDFNTTLLDNTKQQTVMQQAMKDALQQMVKNTDPNQLPRIGGYV